MCTVIAKETEGRLTVLTGLRCCLAVEDIQPYIPKVSRENGWFELYVGEIGVDVPAWATWLPSDAREKATADLPETYKGKRVWFFDVGDRIPSDFQASSDGRH